MNTENRDQSLISETSAPLSAQVEGQTKALDGKEAYVSADVKATPLKPRQHILASAGQWFNGSRKAEVQGHYNEAIMFMENAYNHVENALAACNDFIESYFVRGVLRFPDGRTYREHAKELLSRTGGNSHAVGASAESGSLVSVEGQTDEEIAREAAKAFCNTCLALGWETRNRLQEVILAALRAKSEKPQSSGKKEWQSEKPDESGLWWWWNGDEDCAPIPLNIAYSGSTGRYFVMRGQYGMFTAPNVDSLGGLWMRLQEPSVSDRDGSPATSVPAKPTPIPSESEKDTERESLEEKDAR